MKVKEPNQGPLEKMDNQLHRWQNEAPPVRRSALARLSDDSPHNWPSEEKKSISRFLSLPILRIILAVAILFFVAMIGVFGWLFLHDEGRVSIGNVTLEVAGPKTVKAGEEVLLNLTLANGNSVPLEFVDLIMEYPPGTRSADVKQTELTRERFSLGTLKSGETRKQTVKFVLFGEANTPTNIKISTEYRLQDSNAIFDKITNYGLEITDAPITLSLVAPDEVSAGQEVSVDISIDGEAKTTIENVTLLVRYPSGFKFKKATPSPVAGNNARWDFPSLKPGEKKKISLIGTLDAQDNEQRSFRAEIGTNYQADGDKLTILYDTELKTISILRSSVALSATINDNEAAEVVGNSKSDFHLNIGWNNLITEAVKDGELTAIIEGEGIDRNSINVARGFYRSSDSSISWNKTSVPDLASIGPGENGSVEFSFSGATLLVSGDQPALKNPEVNLRISFKGNRVLFGEEGTVQPIEAEITRKIKLNSVVELVAQGFQRTGPIPNTGPLPPRVGQKTTYTVVWSLANSSNNLEGVRVQATLPLYLEWVGNFTPASEPLEFVPAEGGGGEVIWKAGTVRAETGSRFPRREVAFQVALTPSAGQVGKTPTLLEPASFSATDSFTRQALTGEMKRPIDTLLVSEAGFKVGEEKVVE
jgi:hypothetical protein